MWVLKKHAACIVTYLCDSHTLQVRRPGSHAVRWDIVCALETFLVLGQGFLNWCTRLALVPVSVMFIRESIRQFSWLAGWTINQTKKSFKVNVHFPSLQVWKIHLFRQSHKRTTQIKTVSWKEATKMWLIFTRFQASKSQYRKAKGLKCTLATLKEVRPWDRATYHKCRARALFQSRPSHVFTSLSLVAHTSWPDSRQKIFRRWEVMNWHAWGKKYLKIFCFH